jgi:hypothetical protein
MGQIVIIDSQCEILPSNVDYKDVNSIFGDSLIIPDAHFLADSRRNLSKDNQVFTTWLACYRQHIGDKNIILLSPAHMLDKKVRDVADCILSLK